MSYFSGRLTSKRAIRRWVLSSNDFQSNPAMSKQLEYSNQDAYCRRHLSRIAGSKYHLILDWL
jgi:hypothetical protein